MPFCYVSVFSSVIMVLQTRLRKMGFSRSAGFIVFLWSLMMTTIGFGLATRPRLLHILRNQDPIRATKNKT